MSGFGGGESKTILAREIGYRTEEGSMEKVQWNCLTTLDLPQVENNEQLIALVNVRSSLPPSHAMADAEAWMQGRIF